MMGEQHYPGEVTLNNNNFDQGSEGLTQNIDKLNQAYNPRQSRVFDGPANPSNTDYVNSRYHQSSKQRIDLANRLAEQQEQQSNNRQSITSTNRNDANSGAKSPNSARYPKQERKSQKKHSNAVNNSQNVEQEEPRNSGHLKKEKQVPHLSLNIVGSTL